MSFTRQTSPHGSLVVLSTMKDEGPFVVEWVAHHLALGFTELMVYTNDCSDGTDTLLKRLEAMDTGVHHRENVIPKGMKPHPSMLKAAAEEPLIVNSDWVLVIDADEFMVINHPSGTLDGLVTDLNAMDAHAIVMTWRIFGSSGVRDWSRAPITDQFTRAAPEFWNKGWGTKTMLRFDAAHQRLGMHRPVIKEKFRETDYPDSQHWVNGSGRPLEEWFKFRGWRSIRRTVGYDWAQINHYAIKSMDAYTLRKFRGNANGKLTKYGSDYWSLQDRNEVEDLKIARHRDRRERIMAALLQDDEVRALHEAAHARAEARLAEIRLSPDYQTMVDDLITGSGVPISQVVAKPPKLRDKEAVKAVQTKLEQRRNALPKEDRRTPPPPGWGSAFASPYVSGSADLSADIPLEVVENQTVKIPLDPRVFTAATMEVLKSGKFDRRHARNIAGFLNGCTRLLDLDCGIGFVALRARAANPDLQVTIHEERPSLLLMSRRIAALNFAHASGITWSQATLNAEGIWSGLHKLLASARPEVLRLSGPLLPAEAFTEAALTGVRRILVPFLDPSEVTAARTKLAPALAALGFAEDMTGEPNGTIYLRRE
ncbi:MAG: glycosyltransferase family 2 protein [Tabrizicola sp.]|uniref:glycosyltransferase family 2 protein n=1 Tax=Tabrizicola sp. TaxID=2005166 RepID=UPI002ABB74B6|nr:glycosyltransferase family 2 protein [Tabrizicola sp.]MDZ4086213.1 glycosyltransferase family 2 protein [Tabrizicola sp.]